VRRGMVGVKPLTDATVLHRQISRPVFFYRSFFWALLEANSCVPQLRGFCFPGSARTPWVPSHKAATRSWVPQKNGAEREDISMSYLSVKWE
jgi:hypothetical protein